MASDRGAFGRMGFVLAAAGSAIGLGNIWKFPYITYANDGGTFVLIYLGAVVLIGAPVMMAEILIGRRTQQSPVGAFLDLARGVAGGRLWALVGWLGVVAGAVILSYYSVVAGWTLYYTGECLAWSSAGFTSTDAASLGQSFGLFLANGPAQVAFHGLFMLATMATVAFGVKGGIERVTKLLMPLLFAILIALVAASAFAPGFPEALHFLFHLGPVKPESVLEAVGQAFFSLSLGMGAMITYGSYLGRDASIPRSTAAVCVLDTLIAMLACVVMFSIIFTVPAAQRAQTFTASATILFTTLPRMFYALPGGAIIAPVFYVLVAFAALTSTISLLEVVVSYFIDRLGWQRRTATLLVGAGVFLLGVPSALSLGGSQFLSTWAPLGAGRAGVFSSLDYLATNWLLPLGGLLIALFAGWFLTGRLTRDELGQGMAGGAAVLHPVWRLAVRVVAPVAVAWVILAVIGGKSFS